MAEVVGLVLNVIPLWQNCVQLFDVVDSARRHGMDYELLCVKLEVERMRLLCWGEAIGLSNSQNEPPTPDRRLHRVEVRRVVMRLLGCIQQVFENSDRLQEKYGLRPTTMPPTSGGDELLPSQSQLILGGVFKRAYESLRRVARERQRSTPLARKTMWAVHDRKKFSELVVEIRGLNDSLDSLFPDAQARVTEAMKQEIDTAAQVDELRLLQEATAEDHEALSESVSVRLEALGATVSARTELLSKTGSERDTVTLEDMAAVLEEADEGVPGDALEVEEQAAEPEEPFDEVSKKLRDVELYVAKKSAGALTLSLTGPTQYLEHVSAHVHWDLDERDDTWPSYWNEKDKGFVQLTHASFELYRKRKFMRKTKDTYGIPDSEDHTLLDPESHAKFENVNPGTVTVEGFGIECWDFEYTKPRKHRVFVSGAKMPSIPGKKLLRRSNDLRKVGRLGWSPDTEELDLKEFVGSLGDQTYERNRNSNFRCWELYSVLNRTDIFADFTTGSSVGLKWAGAVENESVGLWNFLWQVIIAKELARRLDYNEDGGGSTGFTPRILAGLIISDLWLKNIRVILTDAKISTTDIKKPETAAEKAKAEDFKNKGNDAMKKKHYQEAVDRYTEAINIDLGNAVYRCNRSAAFFGLNKYEQAEEDAYVATQLDPKYAKAWSRFGAAKLKMGCSMRAKEAYEKALAIAGNDATDIMRQGLVDARAQINEAVKAIESETNIEKCHKLRSDFLDQDWDLVYKTLEIHSSVHEQQVEGLLLFAEQMKWPYINELRDYAEDVYSNLLGGQSTDINLYDWLYGIILPGKWFAFKIMTALILCTPSIKESVGIARYYECGLSLPTRSYWRTRTVLGRVLGCLPGVLTLCGWIGPCPAVEFDPPMGDERPQHIRVKTRRIRPAEHPPDSEDNVIHLGPRHHRYEATRIQPDEEMEPYLADMTDSSRWIIPEPPIRQISTTEIKAILLKKLPLGINVAQRVANGEMMDTDVENETEYRASMVFKMDDSKDSVTYKLFTNPVFVTPPPCRMGPKGSHEVHMRELPRYQKNIWTVEQLKNHNPEDSDDDVMIINATGKGAEVLARAWCSERGKNAVIRRAGGPCFVCAVRAAGKASLGTGVLIWLE